MSFSLRAALLGATALCAPVSAIAQETTLPDVVVSANRTPTEAAKIGSSVTVITEEDLEREGQVNLIDYLNRIPGVSFSDQGTPGTGGTFQIRGAFQRYVLVRVDGIEIADPSGFQVAADLSQLTVDEISRIEVLKGSQSALYGGEAVGGVIDITTKRATQDGLSHRATLEAGSFGTARGAYTMSGGFDRGEFAVTARGLRTDGISSSASGDERDGFKDFSLSATGSVELADGFEAFGAARYSERDLEFDPSATADSSIPQTDQLSYGLRAGLRAESLGGDLSHEVSGQYFRTERDTTSFSFGSTSETEFDGDRIKFEYLGNFSATDQIGLTAGADWTYETAETDTGFGGVDGDARIWGAFAQLSVDPLENLTLTGAVRRDDHSRFGGFTTWRATAAYRPSPGTKLRGSAGSGFRAPSINELFDPSFGNPDVEEEQSFSWDVGVEQSFLSGRLTASATYFQLETDNLIGFDPVTFAPINIDGVSKREGVELELTARPHEDVDLSAGYAYIDAKSQDGARLVRVPRHDASAGVAWRPTDQLSIAANGRYVFDVIDTDFSTFPSTNEKLDSYFLLGVSGVYEVTDGVALTVRGENLLDQDYQTIVNFGQPGAAGYVGVRVAF